ncbi:MAG TPA: M13 family metallopeptidase [Burkholderiaceae bacterium]|nr:M13 family metallopeptidase [Burkholderiaceae bacterium]HQR71788.1 M13 family metallopeptidase [Burkholderiaceae bacterium]
MRRALLIMALATPVVGAAQVLDLSGLGAVAAACTDFDDYVNGAWKQATPIPADRARIGSFDTLRDESRLTVIRALAGAARDPALLDTPGKRLAEAFYASGMDVAAVERRGLASVRPLLSRIDRLDDRAQLPALLGALARYGIDAPLRAGVAPDAKDRRRYIVGVDQGGLGLPDREDYFHEDTRTLDLRRAYEAYRLRLARLVGAADPAAAAASSFDLQKEFAAASQTRVERRDPNTVYQLNTLQTLTQRAPGFDWAAFFKAFGRADPGDINLVSPKFVTVFAKAAAEAPLAAWRAYLRERVLDELAPTLPTAFVEARFDYRGMAIRGVERDVPRADQVINLITGQFGSEPLAEGLGQLYVAHAFSPEAKARAVQMVGDIKAAMRERIERLDWMSPGTRRNALAKLDAMALKIGYPDRWKSYDGLVIERDDFSGNWLRARAWAFDDRLADLDKPVDRGRWGMSPHLVNAYAGGLNDIVFPAAILQPPFFYVEGDPAANYGAIGSVIGHEITHHFDDRGRQFDRFGNLADWWSPEDAAHYVARATRLARQYSGYTPAPGQSIDGQQTLGENISDLGGVKIAYDGLQIALARQPVGPIDGLSQDQRFFISYATIWRAQYRTQALLDQLRTGQHSPSRYRVLGPLANFPAFAKAFGCPVDAPMMRPPVEQITIW